jgi:Uma2 family endonuclease
MFPAEEGQELRVRPLRRAEYDRLVALGVFADERLELLRGALIEMTPQRAAHASSVQRLSKRLIEGLSERAIVRVQLPLALSDDSEPEPDVAVVPPGDYWDAHPAIAWLVIEVADTSVTKDREVKQRLYAEAGIPEYWLVNLAEGQVEIYTEPSVSGGAGSSPAYCNRAIAKPGQRLSLGRFPDVSLEVSEFVR